MAEKDKLPDDVIDALMREVEELIRVRNKGRTIDYTVLYTYAQKHRLNFNELCNVVREAVGE